jgi:hypothetical protein
LIDNLADGASVSSPFSLEHSGGILTGSPQPVIEVVSPIVNVDA